MTVITTTDKIVGLLKNKNAMINKPDRSNSLHLQPTPGSFKSYTPHFYVQEYTRAPSV